MTAIDWFMIVVLFIAIIFIGTNFWKRRSGRQMINDLDSLNYLLFILSMVYFANESIWKIISKDVYQTSIIGLANSIVNFISIVFAIFACFILAALIKKWLNGLLE
jgi:hypothetical protein